MNNLSVSELIFEIKFDHIIKKGNYFLWIYYNNI